MRQKRGAGTALPKTRDAKFFVFGNYIAWPPKHCGSNMRLSMDKNLTHANELATRAL